MLRLIRELLYFKMPLRRTDISQGLDYLARILKKKATVFLVSDFLDTDFKKTISLLNRRHDVIAVPVSDKAEVALPPAGIIEFTDAETGQTATVDSSSAAFRNIYRKTNTQKTEQLKEMLRSINIDTISIDTDKSYIHDLIAFFRMRKRRF